MPQVDVKLEIQKVNQKVNRIEEMISEILKRLGPESGSSSQSPNETESKTKSSNNTPPERPTDLLPRSSLSEGTGLGPIILKKRRSKTRMKGSAPLAPASGKVMSPDSAATSPTETTKMLDEPVQTPSSRKPKDFL